MQKITVFLIMLLGGVPILPAVEFPNLQEWTARSNVIRFGPENLYEYINGAADQFLSYGFNELLSRDVSFGSLLVTVDIYDMGTPLQAFGVYRAERPDNQPALEIGGEAVMSLPYQSLLLKDRFYVKINTIKGELSENAARSLLTELAEKLPGNDSLPSILRILPQSHRIPKSEGFVRQSYLEISDLKYCLFADYQDGDFRYHYFVMLVDNADKVWSELKSRWHINEKAAFPIVIRKIPYSGLCGVAYVHGRLIGVAGCRDDISVQHRLMEFASHPGLQHEY